MLVLTLALMLGVHGDADVDADVAIDIGAIPKYILSFPCTPLFTTRSELLAKLTLYTRWQK